MCDTELLQHLDGASHHRIIIAASHHNSYQHIALRRGVHRTIIRSSPRSPRPSAHLLLRPDARIQAHISNFLNRKRALSLDGLDRVLASQNLTIDQLIPLDLHADTTTSRSHPTHTPQQDLTDIIPVVSPSAAMDDARIAPAAVIETIHVSASRLHDNRARPATRYAQWQRFLAIRADAQQAAAMDPLITPGAIAVLDRHYNSLAPYRAHHPNLYAIRCGAGLLLRFVDFDEGRLILRPYVRNFPVQLLPLLHHETPADYIVGRVCLIFSEL